MTQTFEVKSGRAPLDLVWVIDNSGSMGEKIRQVETNFQRFVDSVGRRTDMKLGVLTSFFHAGGESIDLGNLCVKVESADIERIGIPVGSYNALAMLAVAHVTDATVNSASFPSGDASDSLTVGGRTYEALPGKGDFQGTGRGLIEAPDNVRLAIGALRGFFREDATRIFVVLSDEDDYSLGADQFHQAMQSIGDGAADYKLFGFNKLDDTPGGFASPGRCGGIRAEAYPALAKRTGGAVFDVCASDWSDTFAELTTAVVKVAGSSFVLDGGHVNKILSVEVDGRRLNPEDVVLRGKTLKIDPAALSPDSVIVVDYE